MRFVLFVVFVILGIVAQEAYCRHYRRRESGARIEINGRQINFNDIGGNDQAPDFPKSSESRKSDSRSRSRRSDRSDRSGHRRRRFSVPPGSQVCTCVYNPGNAACVFSEARAVVLRNRPYRLSKCLAYCSAALMQSRCAPASTVAATLKCTCPNEPKLPVFDIPPVPFQMPQPPMHMRYQACRRQCRRESDESRSR